MLGSSASLVLVLQVAFEFLLVSSRFPPHFHYSFIASASSSAINSQTPSLIPSHLRSLPPCHFPCPGTLNSFPILPSLQTYPKAIPKQKKNQLTPPLSSCIPTVSGASGKLFLRLLVRSLALLRCTPTTLIPCSSTLAFFDGVVLHVVAILLSRSMVFWFSALPCFR